MSMSRMVRGSWSRLTTGVVAGRQQDTTRRLANTDQIAGSGRAHDAILANEQLLDAIGSSNLCNDLGDLWVPVAAITANDEVRVLDALGNGQEDGGDKVLRVVRLLEDLDLFAKTRAARGQRRAMLDRLFGSTYVPGFWSVKGLTSTVLTLMMAILR